MKRFMHRLVATLCAVAMATMFFPMAAFTALADVVPSGEKFTVGNFEYLVTVSSAKYVQLNKTVSPQDAGEIINVPSTVTYDDVTYQVIGIQSTAFLGCTEVKDIRIPDLGDNGQVYPEAFGECSSLEVVHFLGKFAFINPTHYSDDFGSLSSVKFVIHKSDWCYDEFNSDGRSGVVFPALTQSYYAVDFNQGGTTQTVYVSGPKVVNGTLSNTTTRLQLSNPSEVSVYCDADEGSNALCPVASVPELSAGYDAWSLTDYNNAALTVNSAIVSTCTADAVASKDLSSASMDAGTLYADGTPQVPSPAVTSADGKTLEAGVDYTLSFANSQGEDVSAIVDAGVYTVTATGKGSYTGTLQQDLTMYAPSAKWFRATNPDKYEAAKAIASEASVICSQGSSDASTSTTIENPLVSGNKYSVMHRAESAKGTVYSSSRVVINPDDFGSSLVGISLAGLFGVTTVSTPKDLTDGDLTSAVKVQLVSAKNGLALVVGDTSAISNEVKSAISDRVNGGATRIVGSSKSAASTAVAAYKFIRGVQNGTYSLTLPDSFTDYGQTAVVLPEAESAASYTVAAWAYSHHAPIFFCGEDGTLDDDTKAALLDSDSSTGEACFDCVVVAGASSSVASKVASQVPSLKAQTWTSSSDACTTSAQWASDCCAAGTTSYEVTVLADANSDCGCLAASACVAGCHGGIVLITDYAKEPNSVLDTLKPFAYQVSYGVLAGNYDRYPQSTMEEILRLWDFDTDATSANLRLGEVELTPSSADHTGNAVAFAVKVTDSDGKVLTQETDYTLSIMDNATGATISADEIVDAGSYTVTATGTYKKVSGGFDYDASVTGYYMNSRSATFTVVDTSAPADPEPTPDPSSNPDPNPDPGADSADQGKSVTPGSTVAVPGKAAVKKLSVGKKKLTATWGKVANATKYQVAYAPKGSKKFKTKSLSKLKLILKKLKKGKRYQVKVRAGNSAGWGAWSKVKTSKKIK